MSGRSRSVLAVHPGGVLVLMPMPLSSQTKQEGEPDPPVGQVRGGVERALGGRVVHRGVAEAADDDGVGGPLP